MKQAALIALVAMLVAGCGSDGNGGENTSSSPTPSPTASELSAADTAACQKFTQAADKARDTISDAETKPMPIIITLLEVAQDDIDTAAGAASEELSGAMSQASGSLGLLIEKVDENNKGKLNNPVELNIAVEWAGAAESLDEVEVLCSV